MSYRGRIPNEVQEIMDELQGMLGDVTTEEQIAKASKFHAGLRSTSDKQKNEQRAWETFLQRSVNLDEGRAWEEIMLYRAIAHASVFFVPEQTGNDMLDSVSVQELTSCAVGWIRLLFEGRLGDLAPNLVEFQKGKPPARGLKRFMNDFKGDRGFEVWNIRRMQALRRTIYDVVHAQGAKKYVVFTATETSPRGIKRKRDDYTTAETQTEPEEIDESTIALEGLPTSSDRLAKLQKKKATEGPFKRQLRENIEAIYGLRQAINEKRTTLATAQAAASSSSAAKSTPVPIFITEPIQRMAEEIIAKCLVDGGDEITAGQLIADVAGPDPAEVKVLKDYFGPKLLLIKAQKELLDAEVAYAQKKTTPDVY